MYMITWEQDIRSQGEVGILQGVRQRQLQCATLEHATAEVQVLKGNQNVRSIDLWRAGGYPAGHFPAFAGITGDPATHESHDER